MRQVGNVRSDALFILLVEKDAAFMRLAEDRFYNTYPCIIITAKGQPDVASRLSSYDLGFWNPDRHCHTVLATEVMPAICRDTSQVSMS